MNSIPHLDGKDDDNNSNNNNGNYSNINNNRIALITTHTIIIHTITTHTKAFLTLIAQFAQDMPDTENINSFLAAPSPMGGLLHMG